MKNKDKIKQQLISELIKIQYKNGKLGLTPKVTSCIAATPGMSPYKYFLTGNTEFSGSLKPTAPQTINLSSQYRFSDLVDLSHIQQLLDSFYQITGIQYSILDTDNKILIKKGWQDICTRFHRVCPQTNCRCRQSDSYISKHLQDGPYVGYKCLNGLVDYAAPIIVEGQHLATIFLGQFLHEPPDEKFFRHQAQEFGFDETRYMEALHQVKIIPEDRIKSIMQFYSQLGQILADIGLKRLRELETAKTAIHYSQEQAAFLADAVDKSSHPFIANYLDGHTMICNSAFCDLLGYSEEELRPMIWYQDLLPPESLANQTKILQEIRNTGKAQHYEREYLRKNGSRVPVEVFFDALYDLDGNIQYYYAFINDITERKQVETELRKSEARYRAIVEDQIELICRFSPDTKIHFANAAYCGYFNKRREEVIGHSFLSFVFDEDVEICKKHLASLSYEKPRGTITHRIKTPAGKIGWFRWTGKAIFDEQGTITEYQYVGCDITKLKQMRQKLKESEEKFSKAFHYSPDPITISTLANGRYIEVNNAWLEYTGYKRHEIIGRTASDIGIWLDPQKRELMVQQIREEGDSRNIELDVRLKSGDIKSLLISAVILEMSGGQYLLCMFKDTTEIKQMEIEMLRFDRLNLVGEMAASIGHEIRNPLTTVRGFLQMFEGKYKEDNTYLDLMIEELDKANAIITEFLSLARDKMVELKVTNLNSTITKILPLINANALAQDKSILVNIEDIPDLLLDEKEISQLIHNLINNGLEAMSSGGTITIRTFIKEDTVVLAVQDQGHGIPAEVVEKLGTPFVTTKENGTGLGLPVCYRIANRHNAKINIETSPSGTTFYVRFPILKTTKKIPDAF